MKGSPGYGFDGIKFLDANLREIVSLVWGTKSYDSVWSPKHYIPEGKYIVGLKTNTQRYSYLQSIAFLLSDKAADD